MIVKELFLDHITPVSIQYKLKKLFLNEPILTLESAVNNDQGNFSYFSIGQRERVVHQDGKSYYFDENGSKKEVDENPLLFLQKLYKKFDKNFYREITLKYNVGFVDGYVGYIGYDMVKTFEPRLKAHMNSLVDDTKIADLDLIRPNIVVVFSHKSNKLTIISMLDSMKDSIDKLVKEVYLPTPYMPLKKAIKKNSGKFDLTKDRFFTLVDKAKKMIKSGDVFQLLLSNRFIQPALVDAMSYYRALRSKNPSPYMFLLDYLNFQLVGSSPEVMVGLKDGDILLRPIAGTRKRGKTIARDIELEEELLADQKERAEHIMLVDLGRNDVGRVAKAGSVKAKNLMHIERYSHVMHIVSDVVAKIDDKYDMFDLFMATFTAGTMTGTPKVRAMELIAEFEGFKRSFYSGSVIMFGLDGNMDSCITIRSSLITPEAIFFHAGAGIVADSKAKLEYLEINNKIAATIATFEDLIKIEE